VPAQARCPGPGHAQERAGYAGPFRRGGAVSVVLRPMVRDDVNAVAVMEEALFGAEAWSPEMLATEVTTDPVSRYYIVADDDGVIAGYGGLLAQRGGQAHGLTLAGGRHRRGAGSGGALRGRAASQARPRGRRGGAGRSSWRWGSTTPGPSACTAAAGSSISASAARTTSRPAPTPW